MTVLQFELLIHRSTLETRLVKFQLTQHCFSYVEIATHHIVTLNWLYAQLHYFLNLSQLLVSCLVSCLPLLAKLD